MDQRKIKSIAYFLRAEMRSAGIELSGIAMFGSQMEGVSKPDSDLDLILISNQFFRLNIFQRADLAREAEIKAIRKFKVPIDSVKMTPLEFRQAVKAKRYPSVLID